MQSTENSPSQNSPNEQNPTSKFFSISAANKRRKTPDDQAYTEKEHQHQDKRLRQSW